MMTQYWLIRLLLLIGFLAVGWLIVRPSRSANWQALKRLFLFLMVIFAMFAVLFPAWLNKLAGVVGVATGINLLVYALVITVFAQIANAYRRDVANEKRLTVMARAVALTSVQHPKQMPPPQHTPGSSFPDGTNSPKIEKE